MSIYRVVSRVIYKETVVVLLSIIFMQNFVVKKRVSLVEQLLSWRIRGSSGTQANSGIYYPV